MRRTKFTAPARTVLAIAVLTLVLAACGGTGNATSSDVTTAPDPTATTVARSADPSTSTTVAVSVGAVDANTASVDEIAAALAQAGVDNADRWAREVVEYRPYDTSDPDLTQLRDELAKYNPGAGVVDLIVSALAV